MLLPLDRIAAMEHADSDGFYHDGDRRLTPATFAKLDIGAAVTALFIAIRW